MPRKIIPALLFPLLSGLLYAFSFPPFNISPLAWICLVPLLSFESSKFLHGFIAGFVANLVIFFWIWKTFFAANIGFSVTFFCWILLSALLALYFGVFLFVFSKTKHLWFAPVLSALLWGGLELMRGHILTGFPWALFAHTQAHQVGLLQAVPFIREEGLSALIVLVNILFSQYLVKRHKKSLIAFASCLVILCVMWGWGITTAQRKSRIYSAAPKFRIAILQGNIDQYQKWDDKYESDIRTRYEGLVEEAVKLKPNLIIWPESAVPGWIPNDSFYVEWLGKVIAKSQIPHLVGAVSHRDGKDFNSAFYFNERGEIVGVYDKQHMVPFGEYIPFGGFLKRWIPYLGQLGTFDSGMGPVHFNVKDTKISVSICYEAIFSRLIKKSASRAEVLVNITNDGWFLDTAAPEQHFNANIFRAVENNIPLVRVANTGISGWIDGAGYVRLHTDLLESGVFIADVPVVS